MKYCAQLLIIAALAGMTASCITVYESSGSSSYSTVQSDEKVKLAGDIDSVSYTFEGISEYSSSGAAAVIYTPSSTATKTTVTVKADKALLQYIKVKAKGDELRIYRTNSREYRKNKVSITVTGPVMTSYELTSASTMSIKGDLSVPDRTVKIETSSSSGIWAESIDAASMSVDASSSSVVKIKSLKTDSFKATATSSSEVGVGQIEVQNAKITASSSADVSLKNISADNVIASATSSADIILSGNTGTADLSSSSSGTISRKKLSVGK